MATFHEITISSQCIRFENSMLDYPAMNLLHFKSLAAIIIFSVTLLTGFLSIGFTTRFRKQLEIGDAVANGIFIGAALFHLLPEAIEGFQRVGSHFTYTHTVLLLAASYFIFWLIEKVFLRKEKIAKRSVHIGILITILSTHASIAGLTLGISETFSLVSILFVAIIAHKGFETFAFVINVYRQIGRTWILTLLLILFSCITPIGILIGMLSDAILPGGLDNLLTAYFSAIAAGTFLYIGTVHSHHLRTQNHDSHQQYARIVATIVGIVLMCIVGIWI